VLNFVKIGLSVAEILQCFTKNTVVRQHAMLVAPQPCESGTSGLGTSWTRDLVGSYRLGGMW